MMMMMMITSHKTVLSITFVRFYILFYILKVFLLFNVECMLYNAELRRQICLNQVYDDDDDDDDDDELPFDLQPKPLNEVLMMVFLCNNKSCLCLCCYF